MHCGRDRRFAVRHEKESDTPPIVDKLLASVSASVHIWRGPVAPFRPLSTTPVVANSRQRGVNVG